MNVPPAPAATIQLVNTLGKHLERMNILKPELDAQQLIQRAQQRTGLNNWGDTSFRPALYELVAALDSQAQLSQVGRITAYYNLLDHLCVRLRIVDYCAKRPEVTEQLIKRPVFILGLPRTGTTILHELITQDPAFRSPATWEVSRPLPPPKAQTYNCDKRIAKVGRLLRVLEKLTPGFQAIHAIGAQLPQECVYMLASSFFSEQFAYMYNVPQYRSWLLEQDMTSAYAWHAQFLQHLQTDTAREHWVLKAPAHLTALDYLLAQYPDASIVWTHRRPLQAVASFSSLTSTLRRGFSTDSDPAVTGTGELEHCAKMVQRGMAARQALDSGQFIDVSFDSICADPISVVSMIYTRLGRELTREARVNMREYLRRRPRNLYGEHRYSAQAFGLDTVREEQLFHDYLSTYENYL